MTTTPEMSTRLKREVSLAIPRSEPPEFDSETGEKKHRSVPGLGAPPHPAPTRAPTHHPHSGTRNVAAPCCPKPRCPRRTVYDAINTTTAQFLLYFTYVIIFQFIIIYIRRAPECTPRPPSPIPGPQTIQADDLCFALTYPVLCPRAHQTT